jgi:hypothetical protein
MKTTTMSPTYHPVGEVETDTRRRIPLASLKLSSEPKSRYRVEEGPKGELRLIPLYSLSADELELLSDPVAMKRITASLGGDFDDFDPTAALTRLDELEAREQA